MKKIMIFFLSILSIALCACHPGKTKAIEQKDNDAALIADHELKSLAQELDVMQNFKEKQRSQRKQEPTKPVYFSGVPIEQIKMVGAFSLHDHSTAFLVYKNQYQSVQKGDRVSNDSIRVGKIEASRTIFSAYPDKFVISLLSQTEESPHETQ
ncbi:MAG: hypothetical protein ABIH77_05640 [Pseudomonadota bacterium]|nr:hypothetical protein [Gammaproteobacteria bacterium]MBU1926515.1 hypothetical protein [Gammaproteobacteria bacterium]MBU2545579.1 hypothetical protein [Gammaproteobacteria bacterium]